MEISSIRSTAYVTPGVDDTDGGKEAYVCISGEITQSHMTHDSHSIRGALSSLETTDTVAFFNLARENVTLYNVPCEMRVHEDYENTGLFTSTVHYGATLSARGQARPWTDRFFDLIRIVNTVDTGFVNIDLPGQMEYEESYALLRGELDGIRQELEGKNIVVLVQGEPVVKYVTCRTKPLFDLMNEECDGVARQHNRRSGTVQHDHQKYTSITNSLSLFAMVYKTPLAEAFAHVAGQCIVKNEEQCHFFVRLPEYIVPMRFSGQCLGVSALGTGSISHNSLTYGSGNGGFLFDANIGKWSISFFAHVIGTIDDTIDVRMDTPYDVRTRLCAGLLKATTPASTGANFFTLISQPKVHDETFELLVSMLMRSIENRYGVLQQSTGRPRRYTKPDMCRHASIGMGEVCANDPLL